MISLALSGPPSVSTLTTSNIWNDLMMVMIRTKREVGPSIGQVMWTKRSQADEAPSIRAAS